MLLCLGREAGNDVGAEGGVRAQPADFFAKRDRVLAGKWRRFIRFRIRLSPCLQRQMKMRHQPLFFAIALHQVVVGLDGLSMEESRSRFELRHHRAGSSAPAFRASACPAGPAP
jgi:hypothetical protein